MANEHDDWLKAIHADILADLPRLVFADALEETGHPASVARAHYIREAVDFFRNPPPKNPEYFERERELHGLKRQFNDEWDEYVLSHRPLSKHFYGRHSRGFMELVYWPINLVHFWLKNPPPIIPLISLNWIEPANVPEEHADLPSHPLIWRELAAAHDWSQLRHLGFGPQLEITAHSWMTEEQLMQLPDSLYPAIAMRLLLTAPSMSSLELSSCGLGDIDIIQLIATLRQSAFLPTLEALDLSGNPITDLGANTLAAAPWPEGFRYLNISNTQIGHEGRARLFQRFGFPELRPLPMLA
jgi:uncharacterized protein (TIGR02996 family)